MKPCAQERFDYAANIGFLSSCCCLLAAHEFLELLEADFSVVVHVRLGDHFSDLSGIHLVAQSRHDGGQLERSDEPIVILEARK